jgi:LmbE family N-acetylglucosaminyl deacetylase
VKQLSFGDAHGRLRILCLGAHCDDIEIGAGATILRLLADRPGSSLDWVTFASTDEREAETRRSAAAFLADAASSSVEVMRYRESYFPSLLAELKDEFERLKQVVRPDLVLTHRRDDEHQDHRTIASLTWNTFRDHVILEYEIPKYEGDLGQPNLYVDIPEAVAERKVELLMEHYPSQHARAWFRPQTFRGMMAVRGVECNAGDGYAEAFHARKLLV